MKEIIVENEFHKSLMESYLGLIKDAANLFEDAANEVEQAMFSWRLTGLTFDDDDELYDIQQSAKKLSNGSATILVFDARNIVSSDRFKRYALHCIRAYFKRCKDDFFEYQPETTDNGVLVYFRDMDKFDLEEFYNDRCIYKGISPKDETNNEEE